MSSHKYWRVSNITTTDYAAARDHEVCELDFINIENVPCNDPSKGISLNAYSSSYVAGNAFDKNTSTKAGSIANDLEHSWWIGYKFDTPVTVEKIRVINSTSSGRQWKSAVVDSSDDGVSWDLYGTITLDVSQIDVTAVIRVRQNLEIRTDLDLPVGTYWWNTITDSNCIFALDSTSQIEFNGVVLRYANNPNKYFISGLFLENSVEKSTCYGYKTENYNKLFNYFYSYKAIKFKKGLFKFKEVLNYPENFTLILYTKVYTNSCFLGKSSTGADHGPAWERVPVNSQQYVYNWRYDLEITGQNYSYSKREEISNPHISYVVYTGSLITGKVKAHTPYGLYDLTTSKHFRSDVNIDLLGYNSPSWNIDADVIAFGVFDKEFTTEEISSVLSKIETDFKIDQKVMYTSNTNQLSVSNSTTEVMTTSEKIKMNLYNFYKPLIQKSNNMLLEKIYTKNLKISKYHNISDYILEEGQPIVSKIFLIERLTGQLIATTVSNLSGYFEFKDIDKNLEYIVVSPHKQYQFKSVLKDYTK